MKKYHQILNDSYVRKVLNKIKDSNSKKENYNKNINCSKIQSKKLIDSITYEIGLFLEPEDKTVLLFKKQQINW